MQVPSLVQPKSNPAILTPAYSSLPAVDGGLFDTQVADEDAKLKVDVFD